MPSSAKVRPVTYSTLTRSFAVAAQLTAVAEV